MTTIPLITTIPSNPPSTSDPTNFDTRADAFLGDFPDLATEINATATGMNTVAGEVSTNATAVATNATTVEAAKNTVVQALDVFATSSSSLSLTAGTKTVALNEAGKLFAAGDAIVIVRRSDPAARMNGSIDPGGVSGQTLTVSVASGGIVGSGGPYTDWFVVSAAFAQQGATAAEMLAAASAYVAATPKALKDALAAYALTDGATVTPDNSLGLDFTWTIAGNRTLAAITNTYPGARGKIKVTQDGTGSRILAVNTAWKRQGGLGTLSTAAGAIDYIEYEVDTVDGSNVATRIIYNIIKAPTN